MNNAIAILAIFFSLFYTDPAACDDFEVQYISQSRSPFFFKIFSKNEYLTRFDNTRNQTRFIGQYNFLDSNESGRLGTGIVTGVESERDRDGAYLENSNNYGGLALRFDKNDLTFEAETRLATNLAESTSEIKKAKSDNRLRFNRWKKSDRHLQRIRMSFITESYLDLEWMPDRDNNMVFNAFDLLGLRKYVTDQLAFDAAVSPHLFLDANKTYDNNRLEMRFNLGSRFSTGSVSLAATGSLVHNLDLKRGDYPGNDRKVSERSRIYALVLLGEI